MNGAQWTVPDTENPHWADAVFAVGFGSWFFTGSGAEDNSCGCAVLINPNQVLLVDHVTPYSSSGTFTLPQDRSANSRVMRARRLPNGTCPAGGLAVDYYQVFLASVKVSNLGPGIVLGTLASPITHIEPLEVDISIPALADVIDLAGWGRDGALPYTGNRPNDARLILNRTIASIGPGGGQLHTASISGTNPGPNEFDSGGVMCKTIGGKRKVTGIIGGFTGGHLVYKHRNDASMQIPGLYVPTGAQVNPSTWLSSPDTVMSSNSPTADNSASTQIAAHKLINGKADNESRIVLAGLSLAGITQPLTTAKLTLTSYNNSDAGTYHVNRIRGDCTHRADWNTRNGVTGWATAGAMDTASDIYTANEFDFTIGALSDGQQVEIADARLLAMAQAAQAEGVPLRLLISSTTSANESLSVCSAEIPLAAYRPRLELSYVKPLMPRMVLPQLRRHVGRQLRAF